MWSAVYFLPGRIVECSSLPMKSQIGGSNTNIFHLPWQVSCLDSYSTGD